MCQSCPATAATKASGWSAVTWWPAPGTVTTRTPGRYTRSVGSPSRMSRTTGSEPRVYDGDRPLRPEELDDPFPRGVLTIARAASRAELTWLGRTIASLDG